MGTAPDATRCSENPRRTGETKSEKEGGKKKKKKKANVNPRTKKKQRKETPHVVKIASNSFSRREQSVQSREAKKLLVRKHQTRLANRAQTWGGRQETRGKGSSPGGGCATEESPRQRSISFHILPLSRGNRKVRAMVKIKGYRLEETRLVPRWGTDSSGAHRNGKEKKTI